MKLPPKASLGSGQPSVWTMRSSGRFVSQISFTPRAKICGLGDDTRSHSHHACDSNPRVPSASATTFAVRSFGAWYELPCVPSRFTPVAAVRTPTTRRSCASRCAAGNPVNTLTPSASALAPSQRTISQIDAMKLPRLCIVGGVGSRSARPPVSRYTASLPTG